MSGVLENLNPKRDAYFIKNFSKQAPESGEHDKQRHSHSHSSQLDTAEVDLNAILSQNASEKSELFYDDSYTQEVSSELSSTKPWLKDPNYFQQVHISPLALLKMTIHARSGGSIEIMGMLTGKIVKNGIVVMDVYPLPVEGTETRVNAQAEGYEFMVQYLDSLKKSGRYENIVGWYHSHPGYGCWLSGIDVATQSLNQQFQDPYLAIVVDPERTMANGKVEIGAFRTYTDDYVHSNTTISTSNNPKSLGTSPFVKKSGPNKKAKGDAMKDIPSEKIQDFGLHSSKYYSLSIEIFRSKIDNLILKNLWNKFWISNLLNNSDEETSARQADRDEIDRFLNESYDSYRKKLAILKETGVKSTRLKNNKSVPERYIGGFTQQGSLRSTEAESLQNQRAKTLSHFKSLSRRKDKSSKDNDDSDSEMNDDSDIDVRNLQDDLEEEMPRFNHGLDIDTGFKFLRDSRKSLTGLSVASPTQPNLLKLSNHPGASNNESNSTTESNEEKKIRTSAAAASRNLVTLKLQEILFLNE